MAILSEAVATWNMRGIAWKAILSEAVVTGGEALGNTKDYNCLEDSTLSYDNDDYYPIQRIFTTTQTTETTGRTGATLYVTK